MFERFGEKLRQSMAAAQRESRNLGHGFIGTDHILLGLTQTRDSIAATALSEVGVDAATVRDRVAAWHRGGHDVSGPLPVTPETKRILTLSFTEARREGHPWTGTGHVLLGLLADRDNAAVRLLSELGIDCVRLRTRVLHKAQHETEERPPVMISLSRYAEIVAQTTPLSHEEVLEYAEAAAAAQQALESLEKRGVLSDEDVATLKGTVRAGADARIALMSAALSSVLEAARSVTAGDIAVRDLVRRGNLGLEQAVDSYSPHSRGGFSDYAQRLIRESMSQRRYSDDVSKPAALCILCSVPVEGADEVTDSETVLICPSCAHRFALAWSSGGI